MMKITALVSLMLIGVAYASRMSCDSCGAECESACGSRRFRACCFNYLRKKRGQPDTEEFWTAIDAEDIQPKSRIPLPAIVIKFVPDDTFPGFYGNDLKITGEMKRTELED